MLQWWRQKTHMYKHWDKCLVNRKIFLYILYSDQKMCSVKSPLCFLFVQQSFMFLFQPQVEQDSLPSKQTLQGQDKRGRGSHSGTMRSNWELGGEGGGKEVRACKHLRMLLLRRKIGVCLFLWLNISNISWNLKILDYEKTFYYWCSYEMLSYGQPNKFC